MAELATMLVSFKADMTSLDEGISKAKEGLGSVGEKAGEAGRRAEEAGGHFTEFFRGIKESAVEYAVEGLDFLKEHISDIITVTMDHQKILAQTTAGLKSTGDASGMTAQSIGDLADSLSRVTPYSADTIQSAENLELTFTNIGKNVFPQATQAVLDLATRMGGDLQGATIQVDKALGNPIQGLTALTRVGVVFNDTQKKLITTYMQHGQVAKAQGVILQELSKEFGGSAEAAGKADGGIAVLKNRMEDLEIKIGTAVTPVISKLVGQVGPLVTNFADWIDKSGILTDITSTLGTDLQNAGNFIHDDLLPPLSELYNAAKPIITDFITWNDKTQFLQNTLSDVGTLLRKVADDVATNLLPPIRLLLSNIETWITKSNIVHDALSGLGDAIGITSQVLGTLIGWISDLVGWFDQSTPRADALKDVLFGIGGIIATMKVVEFGKNVFAMGMQAKDAATHYLDLAGAVKDKLGDAFDWVKGKSSDAFNTLSGRTKSAETDVATSSEEMKADLAGVGTQAETTGAETAAIGAKAEATEAEVATASEGMDASLEGVGVTAEAAAGEVSAVGTAAEGAEAETATASAGMKTSLGGVLGLLGLVGTVGVASFGAVKGNDPLADLKKGDFGGLIGYLAGVTTGAGQLASGLDSLQQGWAKFTGNTDKATKAAKADTIQNLLDMQNQSEAIVQQFQTKTVGILSRLGSDGANIMKTLDTNTQQYWNDIATYIENQSATAAQAANRNFGKIHPPRSITMGENNFASSGDVSHYASGGIAPGGPIMVAENGPEIIAPPAGDRIYNASQTAAMLAGGGPGGGDIHVHATIPVYLDGQQLAGPMGQHLVNEIRLLTGSRV